MGDVAAGQLVDAPAAALAFDGGEQPQCEQDAGIDGVASRAVERRAYRLVQFRQAERLDVSPDDAHPVLRVQPLVERQNPHPDLRAFRGLHAGDATLLPRCLAAQLHNLAPD